MTDVTSQPWVEAALFGHSRTIHEYVRDVLRRAILGGDLPSGSRLVQADIARQLDVSTTPVREALRDLSSEGLISLEARRGGIVRALDVADLAEIRALRTVLEPMSLRRAVQRIDRAQLLALEDLHRRMVEEQDLGTWLDLNRRFHRLHHKAAQSPRLWSMVTGLQDASALHVGHAVRANPEMRGQAEADHKAIIGALRARDPVELERLILAHIQMPSHPPQGGRASE